MHRTFRAILPTMLIACGALDAVGYAQAQNLSPSRHQSPVRLPMGRSPFPGRLSSTVLHGAELFADRPIPGSNAEGRLRQSYVLAWRRNDGLRAI